MSLGRFSLILSAVVFLAFGSAFLFFPIRMASLVSMELSVPSAVIDVRATYGGFVIGMAAFFWLCSSREALIRPGLMAQAVSLGGFVFGRSIGLAVDGAANSLIYVLLVGEISGCALALFALSSERVGRLNG